MSNTFASSKAHIGLVYKHLSITLLDWTTVVQMTVDLLLCCQLKVTGGECMRLFLDSFGCLDIDQLTRILQLVGTPDQEYLGKISSDTVSTELVMHGDGYWFTLSLPSLSPSVTLPSLTPPSLSFFSRPLSLSLSFFSLPFSPLPHSGQDVHRVNAFLS